MRLACAVHSFCQKSVRIDAIFFSPTNVGSTQETVGTCRAEEQDSMDANTGLTLALFPLQVTKSERQVMKPLYDRYRLVKQILCRASTIPVIVSVSSSSSFFSVFLPPPPTRSSRRSLPLVGGREA